MSKAATKRRSAYQRRVVFMAFPRVMLLDLTGPWEVFALANRLAGHEMPPYILELVGEDRATTIPSGGGISMEVIHKIFNPFFTTKDTGSGLGLSIVHKIITRHFGQVEVHNREGEGASFLVTLPAAEEGRAYLK